MFDTVPERLQRRSSDRNTFQRASRLLHGRELHISFWHGRRHILIHLPRLRANARPEAAHMWFFIDLREMRGIAWREISRDVMFRPSVRVQGREGEIHGYRMFLDLVGDHASWLCHQNPGRARSLPSERRD